MGTQFQVAARRLTMIVALGVFSSPLAAQHHDQGADNGREHDQGTGQQMENMDHGNQGQMQGTRQGRDGGGSSMGQNRENGMGQNREEGMAGMDGGMREQMMQRMRAMMGGGNQQASSGQSAFDAIKRVVDQLQQNPDTDWSQVNIDALHQHLVDMEHLTLFAEVARSDIDGGARFVVTGQGRTLQAIQRMLPMHAAALQEETQWQAQADVISGGARLEVTSADTTEAIKIQALGFMGIMVTGDHHTAHHLSMAGVSESEHSGMDHGSGDHSGHD